LFQPFYTTKAKTEGTGLGLSISQSLISRYQGSIEFESVVGKGTVFRVTFPAFQTELAKEPKASPKSAQDIRARGRILVLDDEEDLLNVLEIVLESHHEVVALSDGRTALERIENGEKFDCILCDLMMPNLDGEQFYRKLQMSRPDLIEKFIFLTGGTFSSQHDEFINQPGIRHQEKPIEVDRLLDLIESTMTESAVGSH
jgi:CheY-like chemotaxis protein